MFRRRNLTYLC
jgi:hypothetical protein